MKKSVLTKAVLIGLVAETVLMGSVHHVLADTFNSSKDWADSTYTAKDGTVTTYTEISSLPGNGSFIYEWTQSVSFDPAATAVTSADLFLTYSGVKENSNAELWAFDNDNLVSTKPISLNPAADGVWVTQIFNIQSLFTSFPITSVTLALHLSETTPGIDSIWLDKSVIKGNYTAVAPVPIPSSMLLLGTGVAGLMFTGRRKRQ